MLNAEITNAEMEINGLETKYRSQLVALEKLNAGKKSMEASERTFYFAQKRYEKG